MHVGLLWKQKCVCTCAQSVLVESANANFIAHEPRFIQIYVKLTKPTTNNQASSISRLEQIAFEMGVVLSCIVCGLAWSHLISSEISSRHSKWGLSIYNLFC